VLCPNNGGIFQDDNSPIRTARRVLSWLEEHEYAALQHFLWLAQLPNLNIIEPLWSVLESRVRSRFPPSSLKQLEEEWYIIPLETIQNLQSQFQKGYKLRCRQMVAQLHINKEMRIFHSFSHYFCPSPVHAAKLYSLG